MTEGKEYLVLPNRSLCAVVVAAPLTHLIQLRATHFHHRVIGSGVRIWSGWGTLWCCWHAESNAVIWIRFMLLFSMPGLEDILSSLFPKHTPRSFVSLCQHFSFHSSSSSFSVGFFSLGWFVYPQFPWVISSVIITGVGNKHTHSLSSAHKQTHKHAHWDEKQLSWAKSH